MGDLRFSTAYRRVRDAPDPLAAIHALPDEDVIAALAGAAGEEDAHLLEVLAEEGIKRARARQSLEAHGTDLQAHLREVLRNPDSRSDRLARIILDEMYQFVALLDTQGTLLDVNQAALEGGGLKRRDIVGRPFWDVHWWTVSQATQAQLKQAVARAANGEFIRYEVDVYGGGAGSELITIDFSMRPIRDDEGNVVMLLPEGRNITEKKLAEAEIVRKNEELRVLNEKLKEFDELKTQFFANVSHELRTPLALVMGPTEKLLREGGGLTDAQRASLHTILRNARILLKHVNDLLDVAKLDARKMEVRHVEADLAKLVRLVAGNFDALAAERGIQYRMEAPDALPAQVDPGKIERVVLNLLSNAFKFTPDGGEIRCVLREVAPGPDGRPRARLDVHDNGPGVPAHLRSVVFERFRQGEGGANRRFGGTGLGLAIAKDFAELHGGSLTLAESDLGGALFTLSVPLRAPQGAPVAASGEDREALLAAVAAGAADEVAVAADSRRAIAEVTPAPGDEDERPLVLVVEDNPEMRRFIAGILAPRYRTAVAADGQQGFERARDLHPDLILSDVMMPRMSGDEMVTALREHPETRDVPVILLTAKADDSLRYRMLGDGVQDYVTKPFAAEEVLARVHNLVTLKRARDVLAREAEGTRRDVDALAREVAARKRELQEEVRYRAKAEDEIRTLNENLERRVIARTRDLESMNRELEAFNYSVSHDLKAPLRGIEFLSQVLKEDAADRLAPEHREHLDRLFAQSQRLGRLVSDLLTLARVGRTELNPVDVDLTALARSVVDELRNAHPERDVRVSVAEGLNARADPTLARLLLENLIGNAWKYTARTPTARIEVAEATVRGERAFVVRDNGAGFDPARTHELFEPFKRLHAPTEFEGSGIGLATVRRIVQQHGGRAWAEGKPGDGAEFYFTLG